jgi:chromosome segregation ATPase
MSDKATVLHSARRRDGHDKRARARLALAAMVEEAQQISFEALSRRAGVSRSFLYADAALKAEVAEHRGRQAAGPRAPSVASVVSEASLRTDLALSRHEVAELRQQLAALHGRLARTLDVEATVAEGRFRAEHVEGLESRLAELAAENASLAARVGELDAHNASLAESLEASRVNHRRLMTELNRAQGADRSADAKRRGR